MILDDLSPTPAISDHLQNKRTIRTLIGILITSLSMANLAIVALARVGLIALDSTTPRPWPPFGRRFSTVK
jgi:hypothetical protein